MIYVQLMTAKTHECHGHSHQWNFTCDNILRLFYVVIYLVILISSWITNMNFQCKHQIWSDRQDGSDQFARPEAEFTKEPGFFTSPWPCNCSPRKFEAQGFSGQSQFTHGVTNFDSSILTHWGRDKVVAISRRHFQMHFLEWKCMDSD